MRIVLNTSSQLDEKLKEAAKNAGKSIRQLLIDDAESKYLQSISSDTLCLKKLIADAKEYSKTYPIGKCFTVSDLPSIKHTALQDEIAGKRSAQRASVTRRLIRAIKDGDVPNVCCLLDREGNAVKIGRNSAFIIVKPETYQKITGDKIIEEKNNEI